VHRSTKDDASRFARIDNATLQNPVLSFRARGVLAFVLSMSPSWRHSAESLARFSTDGVKAIRSALRELVAKGHARLVKVRDPHGHVTHRWEFAESPVVPSTERPSCRKGHSDRLADKGTRPSIPLPQRGAPSDGKEVVFQTTINQTTIPIEPAKAAPKKAAEKPSTPRQRNPLIDALAAVDGSDTRQLTASAWSGFAKALKEIREVCPDVTPEEIRRRAGNFRLHFPKITPSPHALGKWWARCDRPPAERTASAQPDAPLRMIS